jgi:hypothetical protein
MRSVPTNVRPRLPEKETAFWKPVESPDGSSFFPFEEAVRHRFPLPAALAFEEHCYSLVIAIGAPVIALFLQRSRRQHG